MRYPKKKHTTNKRKLLIGGIVCAIVSLAGVGSYLVSRADDSNRSNSYNPDSALETKVGQESADNKGTTPQPTEPTSPNPSTPDDKPTPSPSPVTAGDVTPVITYAGYFDDSKKQIEVNAFVPEIFENGTCTLTLTRSGAATITKTNTAAGSVKNTNCKNFVLDRSELSAAGEWSAVVSYSSASHSGISSTQTFTVQ